MSLYVPIPPELIPSGNINGDPNVPSDIAENIKAIRINSDLQLTIRQLREGFRSSVIEVPANSKVRVIPASTLRKGYILCYQQNLTYDTGALTIFASRGVVGYPTNTYNSDPIVTTVPSYATVYLHVLRATGAGGSITVNLQGQDPVSGNWITISNDIFSGFNSATAPALARAEIPSNKLDQVTRLQVVTVNGVAIPDFTISEIVSPLVPTAGTPLIIGNMAIAPGAGMPLLPNQYIYINIYNNAELWAMNISPNFDANICYTQLN